MNSGGVFTAAVDRNQGRLQTDHHIGTKNEAYNPDITERLLVLTHSHPDSYTRQHL